MLKGIVSSLINRPSHIATLWVQPGLFHISISEWDQAPALCALPQGARIPRKLTLIQSPGNACKQESVWGYTMMCVCVCVSDSKRYPAPLVWSQGKVHSEMCGLGSRGAMASVNGEGRVSTSNLSLSSFSRLLCHLHFSPWHALWPPSLVRWHRLVEVKWEQTTKQRVKKQNYTAVFQCVWLVDEFNLIWTKSALSIRKTFMLDWVCWCCYVVN